MPLYRRLPKRGFNKPNAVSYNEVNLGRIQAAFDAKKLDSAAAVTVKTLAEAGVITHSYAGVRILGKGEIKTKAAFEVFHASKGAIAAIEKAGGSVKMLKPSLKEKPIKGKNAKAAAKGPEKKAAAKAEKETATGDEKPAPKPAKAPKKTDGQN